MYKIIWNVFYGFIVVTSISTLQTGCTSHSNTYYLSQQGDDNNPGTKKKPFSTLQKVNSLQLKAGDKIYLKGGENFKGTLIVRTDGTQDSTVIISSYENEKGNATIDGGNDEAIVVTARHFLINNISVKGSGRKSGN